jgi:thiamine biosynthesis lipoprotein
VPLLSRQGRAGAGPTLIALAGALVALAGAQPAREVRLLMGTTVEVRAAVPTEGTAALAAAFDAIEGVDAALSLWHESELTRLNDTGRALPASDALRAVLTRALEVGRASSGAFDPTVEPLVRLRGGLGGPRHRLIAPCVQDALRHVIGLGHVHLAADGVTLDPGTRVDLGGIAKGFAVDRALAVLRAQGATSALVDTGGSSLGVFGEPLLVVIRDPARADAQAWGTFVVRDEAVGSSGADQRGDHIVDPRTLRAARLVKGATVVARDAMEADALGTALFVLGAAKGLAVVEQRGAEGFVLTREGGRRTLHATRGFAERHGLRLAPGVTLAP